MTRDPEAIGHCGHNATVSDKWKRPDACYRPKSDAPGNESAGYSHLSPRARVPVLMKNLGLSIAGLTATSKKPTIISAQVCSPHVTAESGSGLCGLFFELSNVATACRV